MQRQRDQNELAFRILRAALRPDVGRKGDPRMRTAAAMRIGSIEAFRFDRMPKDRHMELSEKGGEANRLRVLRSDNSLCQRKT